MFESSRRLREDIDALLGAVCHAAEGRYACLLEPGRILLETPRPEGEDLEHLRRLIEANGPAIFDLPAAVADENAAASDPFDGWTGDELCLVVVNGKVALLVACPDAEAARDAMMKPLRVLVDRLLRLDSRYRRGGRGGFFFGSPRLDFVVIGPPEA